MALKEMQPRLQLSFEEFTDTWGTLIEEYCQRGIHLGAESNQPSLSDEELVHFNAELTAILLFIAVEIWNSRKRISSEIRQKSTESIAEKLYRRLYGQAAAEVRQVYEARRELFSQICHNVSNANPQKRQTELIGFARYLTAQVSDCPEQENLPFIQQLSILFMEAAATFFQLAENSYPDLQGFGKTKFIVQK